ncbi:hypothetical protein EV652_104354 [Kribbella steppae]|uniref:Uncharacterized protein n=1 Tax=Kribbella steppae TaxID=2512223 RepID=A0A4R2HQK1_9ACTN|nr:hypothetical protein [Kribbella steppae]TCO32748.1 hypothetical protein EV652_104354 [Kribbella steppae]
MRFRARTARFLFAGLLLVGAGAVVGAPTAAAGSNESVVTERGSVAWYHDGDKVVVCDAKADGLSIEANYRLAGGTTPGRVLHVAGAGNCDSKIWDKTEGQNIQIRMCYRDGFVITKCSNWQAAEA